MPITGTNFDYANFSGGKGKDLRSAFAAVDTAITNVTVGTPSTGVVTNAMVNASAAIAFSKLAALTATYIIVGNGSNVPTAVAVTGDIAISNAGVTSIASGVIINDDVKSDAAIAWSKLATSTDISSTGTVTDLTIPSEAQGDVLYRNATIWTRLAAGTAGQALLTAGASSNPYWGEPATTLASKLTASFQMEAGTYDITHAVTTQTAGTTTLTIPDFANVNDTYAFVTLAQTLVNKTLTLPKIATTGAIVDAGGDEYLKFVEATTPVTYIQITSGDTTVMPRIQGAGETNIGLALLGSGTGKVSILDSTDNTKICNFDLSGQTTGKTLSLASVCTDNKTVTFPNANVTLASLTGTETLTNKTLTLPKIATTGAIVDAGGDEYLVFIEAATPVTYIQITSGNTGTAPRVQGAGETNTSLRLMGSGTGMVIVSDSADSTKEVKFDVSGAGTGKSTTLTFAQTSTSKVITFPDATCTLASDSGTLAFTNKTIDCNGTGNVVTNVNAEELDPIALGATAVVGIPFVIVATVTNLPTTGQSLIQNSAYKYIVVGADFVNTSAPDAAATWQLCQGTAGAVGTAITEAVAADNADKIKTIALTFDDATSTIASGTSGDLCVVGDASGTLDGILTVYCVRID